MSKKYIGDVIDIHAGGEDLIFPHHENEIAQSEAANGTEFARYWMHNGFLKINNEKMSKSLGNFFTVREIAEKYPLQVIRFFMLSAHYRSPLNFSAELVEASKNGLERILTAVDRLKSINGTDGDVDKSVADEMDAFVKKYEDAMDDDLNTADAISVIFELVKYANVNVTEESSKATVELVLNTIEKLCDILGIITEKKEEILDSDIEALIEERQAARKAKNFARADEIRDQLSSMGYFLMFFLLQEDRPHCPFLRKQNLSGLYPIRLSLMPLHLLQSSPLHRASPPPDQQMYTGCISCMDYIHLNQQPT